MRLMDEKDSDKKDIKGDKKKEGPCIHVHDMLERCDGTK